MNNIFTALISLSFFILGTSAKKYWSHTEKNENRVLDSSTDRSSKKVNVKIDSGIKNSKKLNDEFSLRNIFIGLDKILSFQNEYDPAQFEHLLKELKKLPFEDYKNFLKSNPQYMPLVKYTFQVYADTDPEKLFEFYRDELKNNKQIVNRFSVMSGILCALVKVNPDLALDYFSGNIDSFNINENRSYPGGIIRGLFLSNPNEAIKVFSELSLKNKDQLESLQTGFIYALASRQDFLKAANSKEVMKRLGEMNLGINSDPYKRWSKNSSNMKKNFFEHWSKKYPFEAANWTLDNTRSTEQQKILKTVVQECVNTDVTKTAELIENYHSDYDPGFKREKFIEGFLELSFNEADSDKVISWIGNIEGVNNQRLFKKFLETKVEKEPLYAASHLDKINDESSRERLSLKIYQSLKGKNPKLAARFYQKTPFKSSLKNTGSK